MKYLLLAGLLLLASPIDSADEAIFDAVLPTAPAAPKPALFTWFGKQFLGKPYVSATLDRPGPEMLRVNLREFDCTTFVENMIALSLTRSVKPRDFGTFKSYLTQLRYRNGRIEGYGSRVHYLTEWLLQLEKAGRAENIGRALGGVPLRKDIHFMTSHRDIYLGLQDPTALRQVQEAERRLSQQVFYYLPGPKLAAAAKDLHEGDIVAFTTPRAGLDVVHVGFVTLVGGQPHLLHASSELKKVVVSSQPLPQYLAAHRLQNGVMITRWKN